MACRTMRKWLISLAQSPNPALSAMAPELTALIAEADAAVTAQSVRNSTPAA
jgi:hypothetical protein